MTRIDKTNMQIGNALNYSEKILVDVDPDTPAYKELQMLYFYDYFRVTDLNMPPESLLETIDHFTARALKVAFAAQEAEVVE